MDGAYVPDEHVEEHPDVGRTVYGEQNILTRSRSALLADHRTKTNGTLMLIDYDGPRKTTGRNVRIVPYRLFYVSRNLEHAFRGWSGNLSDGDKQRNAAELGARFAVNPDLFADILTELWRMHGAPDSWKDSWKYAMTGTHSLERGSNLRFVSSFLKEL